MVLKNTLPNKLCDFTLLLYLRSFFEKLLENASKMQKKTKKTNVNSCYGGSWPQGKGLFFLIFVSIIFLLYS